MPESKPQYATLTWLAQGDPANKCGRRFFLFDVAGETGIRVQHCGHPTAHFPWYIQSNSPLEPDGILFCGTFQYLKDAKRMAEQLWIGDIVIADGHYIEPVRMRERG